MIGRWIWVLTVLVLAAIAALTFVQPEAMLSPGPMLAGHEALATDCFACHAPLRGSRAERCTDCHAVDRIGRFTTAGQPLQPPRVGFHQQLQEQDCMACHAEHRGTPADAALKPFSHGLLKTEVQAQCSTCHAKPRDGLHDKLQGHCQGCHTTQAWKPSSFAHEKYFLLDRDHDVACATCHVDNDFGRYSCYGCHEHTPARIRAKHVKEGIRDFEHCVDCHRGPWEPEEDRHRKD